MSQEQGSATVNDNYTELDKTSDKVRVFVSLEAIRYEYTVRNLVRKAWERSANKLCVCRELVLSKEHEQEFWPAEKGCHCI
jgi:hypothetical protein